MQIAKKYLTEGLIQFTILLSLIGVRVDVDSYLNGYLIAPHEINLGPSSAYIQTPFHSLRDNLDGYSVHPKCPELDYFFASRRLLDEVRTLGSPTPRFPTQLNAWLVHQVPDTDRTGTDGPSDNGNGVDITVPGLDSSSSTGEHATGDAGQQHLPDSGQEECQTTRPYCSSGACEDLREEDDTKEEEAIALSQLTQSSTLEQESMLDSTATLSDLVHPHPIDIDQQWSNFLSLPVTDLDDLDPLVMERLSDLDSDMVGAISQDVSLSDAMVTRAGLYGAPRERPEGRLAAQRPPPFFRLESANASHSPSGLGLGGAVLPFASVCNATRNASSSHGALDGCLDEAVFEQINLLGLEGLDTIDSQMLESLGSIDPRVLEDLDSDSGLSLESSSQGPASPGTEVSSSSSSSSSYCGDEGGATGYSSEVDSLPTKGIADYTTEWSPVDLSESVWHDHSYSSPAFLHQPSAAAFPHKGIKEEPLSEEDEDRGAAEDDREMSRDEMRARSMCIPFSALQIVNMPVEEFLEVLEGHGFSSEQVTLLRDIRRRGKNKLAAQNCRKRKLDAISGLQEEVARLHAQRDRLLREKQLTTKTMGAVGQQIKQLTRDVLSRLRDESGRALDAERYTLQCGANGRVVVQPIRKPAVSSTVGSKTDKRKKDKK